MQVSSELKCPWCFYAHTKKETNTDYTDSFFYAVCPRCDNVFHYYRDREKQYHTSADCEENRLRHNWNYSHVEGYDLFKKCRRCGKEDSRPAQTKLPGFQEAKT